MSEACILELQPLEDTHFCQQLDESNTATINRRSYEELSYNEFYWKYMHANWPVVLTDVSNAWSCRQFWTLDNRDAPQDGQTTNTTTEAVGTAINYDYLRHRIGDLQVPVANCSREYFNSHAKLEMNFHDYLDYWQRKCQQEVNHNKNETICTTNSYHIVEPTTRTETDLYLKDWHLKAQMPDYDFYRVPKHFVSDWLNEYLIENAKDDYRFVYMGPKDSWTPFHADVFGSYSWSTNIVGRKRWFLLPPGEETRLKDKLGNDPLRITEQLLRDRMVRHFIVDQTENESLFVPSGWYHQVHNVTDTISVNHNWLNACNLQQIWRNLAANMQQVIAEIDDCRQMENFDEHCQTMLRASFGWNFNDFVDMLEYIAKKRLHCYSAMQSNNNNVKNGAAGVCSSNISSIVDEKFLLFNAYALNEYHVRYDLHCISPVIEKILQNDIICEHSDDTLQRRCLCLKELTSGF